MKSYITYSILQYKHSLLLGEAINIGVLFYFPEYQHLQFAHGNNARVKSIYNDFDSSLFNSLIVNIKTRLKDKNDLFRSNDLQVGLKDYISTHILAENSSALQFTEPIVTRNTFANIEDAIKFYSIKLLPGIITDHPSILRHNESFIIKKYFGYLLKQNKTEIEKRINRNYEIHTEGFSWKFDVAWRKDTLNLVKPIAFDLSDESGIQSKSAQIYGYLGIFNNYAKQNTCRFDLLISEPQERKLFKAYDSVLNVLESSDTPKKIIRQVSWESYSRETADALLS